jgi:hypothetical protein
MNTTFDAAFDTIPFYQKYPYMKPFVGDRYESESHNKLLIVGESHYLPASSTVHLNIDNWYEGNLNLTELETKCCNTRLSRLNKFGKCFEYPIEKDLSTHFKADFNDVASLNYFLRPSNQGRSFKQICNIKDRINSAKNFNQIVQILKPDLIVFASRFVYDCVAWKDDYRLACNEKFEDVAKRMNVKSIWTKHPSRGGWHKPVIGGKKSNQIFVEFLEENWMK